MNEPQPRIADRVASRHGMRHASTRCRTPGCGTPTRHSKPYCLAHIDQHRYVREIIDRLESHKDELRRVERFGRRHVDPQGIVAQDILAHVEGQKAQGIGRLARELCLGARVGRAYEQALVEAGLLGVEVVGRRQRLHVLPAGLALLSQVSRGDQDEPGS